MEFQTDLLKTKDVLEILNIGKTKLISLEKNGELIPYKKTDRSKYFRRADVMKYLGEETKEENQRKVILYARVSSNSQKNELEDQVKYLENYISAKGIIPDLTIKDIGSGINYNNSGLNKMLKMIMNKEVSEIVITYKDRLLRFGFDMFENICKMNGTKLTVINMKSTSPEEEIVEDLLTIITVFSNRVYGLRKYSKDISKEIKEDKTNE